MIDFVGKSKKKEKRGSRKTTTKKGKRSKKKKEKKERRKGSFPEIKKNYVATCTRAQSSSSSSCTYKQYKMQLAFLEQIFIRFSSFSFFPNLSSTKATSSLNPYQRKFWNKSHQMAPKCQAKLAFITTLEMRIW